MTLQPRVLINLYTLNNSYIETFYDEDSFISKYNVTKKEMNQIQHGNKYFRDYIVKYSSLLWLGIRYCFYMWLVPFLFSLG